MKMYNKINKEIYEDFYKTRKVHLEYPHNWIIHFWNMYLRKYLPEGKILDWGCGSGNNSIFLIDKGYEVFGCDIAKNFKECVGDNLKKYGYNRNLLKNFTLIPQDYERLPFDNESFDLILSNQVLYYLPSREHIKKICVEFNRILKPNGLVFFTMMGQRNYYFVYHTRKILSKDGNQHEIEILDKNHRLYGLHEIIYFIRDEKELIELFDVFEPIDIGFFEIKIFDLNSHHWIFIGKKK